MPVALMFDFFALQPVLAQLAGRSELDWMRQYRVPAMAAGILFGLGLLCHVWLWQRLRGGMGVPDRVGPKPWGGRELVVGVGIYLWGHLAVQVALQFLGGDVEALWRQALAGQLLLNLSMLVALAVFFRVRHIRWAEAFGRNPGGVRVGLVGWLAAWPPLLMSFVLMHALYRAMGWPISAQPVAVLFVETQSRGILVLVAALAVVVAPFFEEVLFRGLLYPYLKSRWGQTAATLLVSGSFAMVHFHVPSFLPLFVLGVALVWVYEVTDSLTAPITLHAVFNATNLLMLAYVRAQT